MKWIMNHQRFRNHLFINRTMIHLSDEWIMNHLSTKWIIYLLNLIHSASSISDKVIGKWYDRKLISNTVRNHIRAILLKPHHFQYQQKKKEDSMAEKLYQLQMKAGNKDKGKCYGRGIFFICNTCQILKHRLSHVT